MADGKSAVLAPLLERLGQNPTAMTLLGQLLGEDSTPEAQESAATSIGDASAVPPEEAATAAASAVPLPHLPPPKGHDHGHGRRDVLLALRPFLSARRCASVDRVLRALELYEVIEEGRRQI